MGRPGANSGFVVALLVALLVLTGMLAYQAASSARSHRRVAEKAIAEFARVAAWEYAGAARRDLYSNLTNPGLELAATAGAKHSYQPFASWDSIQALGERRLFEELGSVQAYFSYLVPEGTVEWRVKPGGLADDRAFQAMMATVGPDLLDSALDTYDARWHQGILFDVTRWGPRALVFRAYPGIASDPEAVYGFVVDEAAIVKPLSRILHQEAILPASTLGDGEQSELLSVEVRDEAGRQLTTSEYQADNPFKASENLGPAFAMLGVTVAIAPGAAERLVIGGLPRSRLPDIIALLLLTTGVVIAAMRLLRRETELNALRADFVSSISHELRTPIAQIRMFGETLMLDRVRTEDERRRSLEILVKEARRLAHQVDNVLLFSRAEKHTMRFDLVPTPLDDKLADVAEAFEPLATSRDMVLETDLDPGITASVDPMAFEQAVLNLLDNAVKYGPEGQTVRLALHGTRDGSAQIVVEDEGPGIPEQDRDGIWEAYARLDRDRDSAIAGTGIGLAVVREVIRRTGGSVRVESGASGGARFVMELPPMMEVGA